MYQSITPATREDIEKQIQSLSTSLNFLESKTELCSGTLSITGFAKDVAYHFTQGLDSFAKGFMEFISKPFESNNPLPQFRNFESYKSKAISLANDGKVASEFTTKYGSIDIPYISGCRVTLLEVVNALNTIPSNSERIIINCLKDVDSFISDALSDEKVRNNPRPFKLTDGLKEGKSFTDDVIKVNSIIIDPTSYEDHTIIIKILPNLNDFKDIVNGLNKLRDMTDAKTLNKIDDIVKSISIKAKSLSDELKDKENKCNKQFISNVKDVLLIGANSVTYLATYYYLITQAAQSFRTLVETMKK